MTRQCRPHNGLPFLFDMFLQYKKYTTGVIEQDPVSVVEDQGHRWSVTLELSSPST